jgi:hypothetical protein
MTTPVIPDDVSSGLREPLRLVFRPLTGSPRQLWSACLSARQPRTIVTPRPICRGFTARHAAQPFLASPAPPHPTHARTPPASLLRPSGFVQISSSLETLPYEQHNNEGLRRACVSLSSAGGPPPVLPSPVANGHLRRLLPLLTSLAQTDRHRNPSGGRGRRGVGRRGQQLGRAPRCLQAPRRPGRDARRCVRAGLAPFDEDWPRLTRL